MIGPDPEVVAIALGMERRGRNRWGPCPHCHQSSTRSDGRPPVLLNREGWYCVSCRKGGDEVALAAWALTGTRRADDRVHGFLAGKLGRGDRAEPKAPEPPKRVSPWRALRQAVPIAKVEDERLHVWLEKRMLSKQAPAGWLPNFHASWWPDPTTWPLILPACTGRGRVESIHGIAVGPAPHKTTWPRGAEARELLFASPAVRGWLAGEAKVPSDVVIVEGGTDYLTASVELPDCAVIGITSGAAGALGLAPKTKGQRWYVATDPDPAGQKYAEKVAEMLFPTPVYPFPLR